MSLGKYLLTAAAGLSLISTPVLAESVSSKSVSRTAASATDRQELEGENGILIAVLAAAAIIAGIIIIADDDDDDDDDVVSP